MPDPKPRLSAGMLVDIAKFIAVTGEAWQSAGLVKENSFGVRLLAAHRPGADFSQAIAYEFGDTLPEAEHDQGWYIENVIGKEAICLEAEMDSHEAVRTWQGLLTQLDGAFPWGGGVYDGNYGLIVCTSGYKEDEDLLFSRNVRNFVVMLLDRVGQLLLDDARLRGARQDASKADRFTNASGHESEEEVEESEER